MKEKVLIKSDRYSFKKIAIILVSVILLVHIFVYFDACNEYAERIQEGSSFADTPYEYWLVDLAGMQFVGGGIALVVISLIYFYLDGHELSVSDKRVYGKTAFGKRVDLPLDAVSAVGSGWPKGITVATSSGRISFLMIKNCDEIHECVSNLLIERQKKTAPAQTVLQQTLQSDEADQLKKFKDLLDQGVITQEEFDAKKKQLLGL